MHWFPNAAASVGGDPLNLHVARFDSLINSTYDIEGWKNGEKESERRDRKFLDTLEGLV